MSVAVETAPAETRPAPTSANPSALDYAYALLLTLAIGLALVASTPALWHWFVLPCGLCGVLIGADAVRWARSRVGLFDPVGLIGVIGFHFFFTAPLLNVRWNQWPPAVLAPPDWRPWLGKMALVNALSIVVYRVTIAVQAARARERGRRATQWRLDPERLWPTVLVALAVSAAAEVYALIAAGGFGGFAAAVVGQSSLAGLGWMLALGESLPMLCFLAWALHTRLHDRRVSTPGLAIAFGAFVLAQFVVGGLRGSRGNLVWPVVIAFGVVHLTIRPVSKRTLAVATVAGLLFMYLYGFYKYAGIQGATDVFSKQERTRLERESGRTIPALLLQDLGRADIQAFLLYRYQLADTPHTLGWGATYVGGVVVVVPQAIWADRPPGKLKTGTDLMYGEGTYDHGVFYAQNIYGLAGEAVLNFGPFAIPLAYVVLGLVIGRAQRFVLGLDPNDSRLYLVPLIGVLCVVFLTSDLGNVVFSALQFGLLLAVAIVFGSRRTSVQPR